MDLNGGCPHLQRRLIEESDELSREQDDHLLSQELCGEEGETHRRRYAENRRMASLSGNIKVKVSTGAGCGDKEA